MEADTDDDQISSNSQMPPPKRTKTSKRSTQQEPPTATPAKRARRSKEPVSVPDEDEEMQSSLVNNISASQALSSSQMSAYSRSGKVARIVLKNFMCHSNFAVDFNDHKNLMVGKNGSGKSAVLTALILGLGSKASTTSRCSSMKQLIKRGENSGSIEIHLFNFPSDGYEYEKFGSRIIINRHMTSTGASKYKIKNAQGHVISTSRDELMQLLMYLNIQVDNPVCVLNQDASRSFLRDSDPKKRFQLFMKATQMEMILEKLNACSVHIQNARVDLKYQKQLAQTYEKELAETQERYDRMQSVSVLKEQVSKLKSEQAWLYVKDQEAVCAEMQQQIDEIEAKRDELRSSCTSKAAMEQKIKENLEAFVAERDQMRLAMQSDLDAYETIRTAVAKKQELNEELLRNFKKVEERQKRLGEDIAQLEKEISERNESYSTRLRQQKEANERRLVHLLAQKDELKVMADSAKRDIEMLIDTKTQENDRCDELNQKQRNIRDNCDRVTRNIKECDTSGKDSLHVYGQYMPRLIARIAALYKSGAFSEMPRGPLGHYIEVDDDKWKMAVENILGNVMHAFTVNNAKDRMVLTELIKRDFPAHSRHPIITSRFTKSVYDVSSGAVHPPTNTRLTMDVLRVRDPVVMNCLIDNCKVETILLTDNSQVAMRLTSDEENVPRRLLRIILIKPFTVFYPAPNYRSYSLNVRHAKYLQVNMTQRKEMLQEELEQLTQSMVDVKQNLSGHRNRLEQITRTLSEKNDQLAKLQNQLAKIQNDILDLKAIEYPENEVEILRNELVELQASYEQNSVALERETERKETAGALMIEKEQQMAELKQTVRNKEMEIRALQAKFDSTKRTLDEGLVNVKYGEQKIRAVEVELTGVMKEFDLAKTKQNELIANAIDLGERIESQHNHKQLADSLRKIEGRIAKVSSSGETFEQVSQTLDVHTKRYEYKMQLVNTLQETLQKLHAARKFRYEGMAQLKTHMSLRIQYMFNNLLKVRDYSGELKIDHANQTLELSVVPRDKNIENAVSNAKSLSGGERSYTTIALLLSLWSCVDYPFYFLDEYDVFTDQVNRHYITKLLFSHADKKKHRQYTFLTPQDMSNVEADDKLNIHRLAEPER